MADDYYRTLSIAREASAEEIHRAYRALALRYHPDRNPAPEAAALMAVVNEAYEILGEPAKRAEYDRRYSKPKNFLDEAVLTAARQNLLKHGWSLAEDLTDDFVLKSGLRRVQVALVPQLDAARLQRCRKRASGFCAVLAVRIEPPLSIPPQSLVVIDVLHSRLYGGSFPDETYRDLFKVFL